MRNLIALAIIALTAGGDSDRASAMVTIASGAHAGRFLVRNADTPCEITDEKAPHPKHQFSVSIGGRTASADSNKLTLLMVIVPDADVREANHTLFASITFGDIGRGTEYVAETRPGEKRSGSGTVTIVPHKDDATVMLDVSSADGVAFTATIQCSSVTHY